MGGIADCGPHNMESPRSLRSCRIHNSLTNVDTKTVYVTQRKVKQCKNDHVLQFDQHTVLMVVFHSPVMSGFFP